MLEQAQMSSKVTLNVDTDVVLLTDTENAFNSVNRKVTLHNLKLICPIIAIDIINCYATPSRLFTVGGGKILPSEGTTQRYQQLLEHMHEAPYH